MIRALIADDKKSVRDGYKVMLRKAKDIRIIGEARDGREVIKLAECLNPDVIIMDLVMPYMGGLEATKRICSAQNHPRIIIIATYYDDSLVEQALKSGAHGYVAKIDIRELEAAVHAVQDSEGYLSTAIGNEHFRHKSRPSYAYH